MHRPGVMVHEDHALDAVLKLLLEQRNVDLRGYRRPALRLRLGQRASARGCSIEQYLDLVSNDDREMDRLLSALRIKITDFFRDAETWTQIETAILPDLIRRRASRQSLRIWSAGCATGQEAYSLGITVAEALGTDSHRWKVRIFATNSDPEAIARGRSAIYTQAELKGVSPARIGRWFQARVDERFQVRDEIRRRIIFGRNDLLTDAPYRDVDLLLCRNVLAYFEKPMQDQILRRFRWALASDGILMLGRAELIPRASVDFATVDLNHRIYRADGAAAAAADPPARAQTG